MATINEFGLSDDDERRRRPPQFSGVPTVPLQPSSTDQGDWRDPSWGPPQTSGTSVPRPGTTPPPTTPGAPPAAPGTRQRQDPRTLPGYEVAPRQPNIDRAGGVDPSANPLPPTTPRTPAPPAGPTIPTGPYTGFNPKFSFEGFDFSREQDPTKSAKDAFAYFANQAPPAPLGDRAALAAWFNQYIAPYMNQLGHKISNVTEDKFDFENWQGKYTIDYARGAGAPGAAFAWQDVTGGPFDGAPTSSSEASDMQALLSLFAPQPQAAPPDLSWLSAFAPQTSAPAPVYQPPMPSVQSPSDAPGVQYADSAPVPLELNPAALGQVLQLLRMRAPELLQAPQSDDPLMATILRSLGQA